MIAYCVSVSTIYCIYTSSIRFNFCQICIPRHTCVCLGNYSPPPPPSPNNIHLKLLIHYASTLFMQGPEVRSGDIPQPIQLEEGQEFNFTIQRGVSKEDTVSVNYDDFVNDVEVGDILLVDGKYRCLSWVLNWCIS